jgi:hypothetical protein
LPFHPQGEPECPGFWLFGEGYPTVKNVVTTSLDDGLLGHSVLLRPPPAEVVYHEGPECLSVPTFVAMEDTSRCLVGPVDVATPAARRWRGGQDLDDRHVRVPVSDKMHSDGAGEFARGRFAEVIRNRSL